MCGRFSRKAALQTIVEELEIDRVEVESPQPSRYNIAPAQDVLAVVNGTGRRLLSFRWGLIPRWADDPKIGYRMINARAETITEKPSFKDAFRQRRCAIIADGFYEWHRVRGGKTPYYIRLKNDHPFAFAGVWGTWKDSDRDEEIRSCAIITTEPNELIEEIHHRMPVILDRESIGSWIDEKIGDEKQLLNILKAYPASKMELHAVSKLVNSPSNDSPDCILPV